MSGSAYEDQRRMMVELLKNRGIRGKSLLDAMGRVKRHLFFPESVRLLENPYGDYPCGIGSGQTISQPYIVAYMIEKLKLEAGDRVLEIGTGSGYQAAVLAEMGMEVFSMEAVRRLYEHALSVLGESCTLKLGDGWQGWEEEAPFRGIILSCAPENIPEKLVEQLSEGGRMVLPLGGLFQRLVVLEKSNGDVRIHHDLPVRFVPMIQTEPG